jgi:protein required for attachment to host cells
VFQGFRGHWLSGSRRDRLFLGRAHHLKGAIDPDQRASWESNLDCASKARIQAMRNARVWILITDGVSARICSTEDGSVHPLIRHLPQGVALADTVANREEEHCQAWYRMQGRSFSIRRTTSVLAGHLVQILSEAAREGAYDGLVVIAAPEIARELDRARLAPCCLRRTHGASRTSALEYNDVQDNPCATDRPAQR